MKRETEQHFASVRAGAGPNICGYGRNMGWAGAVGRTN